MKNLLQKKFLTSLFLLCFAKAPVRAGNTCVYTFSIFLLCFLSTVTHRLRKPYKNELLARRQLIQGATARTRQLVGGDQLQKAECKHVCTPLLLFTKIPTLILPKPYVNKYLPLAF